MHPTSQTQTAMSRVQARLRAHVDANVCLSEELIADRRRASDAE